MPDELPADTTAARLPPAKVFAELWKAAYTTYFDCFFNKAVADRMVDRWQLVDDATKVLVAITASGSALSGWSLWSDHSYRPVWLTFAGLAALLAIMHTALTVGHRSREWGEVKRTFASRRIELETFRFRMGFDGDVAVVDLQRDFLHYRRRYMEAVQRVPNDSLLTRRLQVVAQRDVTLRLSQDQAGDTDGD